MCGIAGVWGDSDVAAVEAMLAAQAHRGPDDAGVWRGHGVVLGHRRLAILDRSARGHQPMRDPTGRLTLVFNGEIYNFRDLRAELERREHTFTTGTDTEVLLHAYLQWGTACVGRLHGMFAFALHDAMPPPGAPDFVLARDRLGIKPLLYADQGHRLLFASELQALLRAGIGHGVDPVALGHYLRHGAIPQPRTLMAGVQALPPASILAVRGRTRTLTRTWDLHDGTASLRASLANASLATAAEGLRERLHAAARRHLVSDAPVGAFLSGGLDSAAVVALTQPLRTRPLRTYAVGFADRHGALDERLEASASAAHLGTEHTERAVADSEGPALFEAMLAALPQPSRDGANTWLVAARAREDVTVALSGLGADELFGGYDHFAWTLEPTQRATHAAHAAAWNLAPHWRTCRAAFRSAPIAHRPHYLRRLLNDRAMRAIAPWATPPPHALTHAAGDAMQALTRSEINGYLLDTLLTDADAMGMAHGLELRPLFLDHEVVEFAYALPPHLKVHRGETKRVLRAALRAWLPEHLREPSRKRGFELPTRAWLRQPELAGRLIDLLEDANARRIFSSPYRHRCQQELRQKKPSPTLWAWGILLGWLQAHDVRI